MLQYCLLFIGDSNRNMHIYAYKKRRVQPSDNLGLPQSCLVVVVPDHTTTILYLPAQETKPERGRLR